jgi:riboflavin kinase / FMN adenylyltransferase
MKVEEELKEFATQRDTVLTIGVFDGVHIGHQRLMEYLKRQALAEDRLPGVVTFRGHPQHVISPKTPLYRLVPLDERIRAIREMGIELVVPLSFNLELARVPARDFVALLQKYLRMRGLIIGADFALGKGREGDPIALRQMGKDMGFWVEVFAPQLIDGEVVSSTAIRQALAVGDVKKVTRLLGRPLVLHGRIVHGDERGKQLGFPTANLAFTRGQALPEDGVYVTKAYLGGQALPSVTNIGKRPTFGENRRTVEVYLIGFSGEIYGEVLRVELVDRLRGEKRFSSPEELKAQISQDVEKARSMLREVVR